VRVLAPLLLLAVLSLLGSFGAVARAGTLTVELLDVGQGDSILIRTPAGKSVLIDAGTGKRDVVPMLQARGMTGLDLVIATHNHADHIGGMDEVLEALPIRFYFDQGMPHETGTYDEVMKLVETKGVAYKPGRRGQVFNLDDGVKVEFLAPEDPLLRNTRSDLNSNSIVTRVTHGKNCFLFVGDAEEETEHRLLKHGLQPCGVLKVAHHGSAYATTHAFLKAVQPQIAVISVGEGNRYGHPTDLTLDRLQKAGATVFRTDQSGRLLLESDGQRVTVAVERAPASGLPAGARVLAPPVLPGAVAEGIAALDVKHRAPGHSGSATAAAASAPPARPPGPPPPSAFRAPPPSAAPSAPSAPSAGSPPAGIASTPAEVGALLRSLNAAGPEQLMSVPGIGPKKAAAIVAWRAEHGPFTSIDGIADVPGIGPSTIAALKAHLSASP
jgi:competence ComEA-like helix-hairpin-helix protein